MMRRLPNEAKLIQAAKAAAEQLRELFEADSFGPLADFPRTATDGNSRRN